MEDRIKYIARNQLDEKWGLTINSTGFQKISPGEEYPPHKHNPEYMFNPSNGRVLTEYQLLYIIDGEGTLVTEHGGRHKVSSGDMFLLFPGEWHSYSPNPRTGWTEYWIGFSGRNIDSRVKEGFFSVSEPMFSLGYSEKIIELYIEAIRTASRQEPYFQQLLAGIVNHILGLVFMRDRNNRLHAGENERRMVDSAKAFMQESVEADISMPDVAVHLGVNYASFRHLFKEYTGMSPAQYFINLRLHRAKEMLRGTNASVKEISIILHFENPEYFATHFKKKTGMSPSEFRRR